ncbi:methyl viologen-reducing hydrogenase [bacterium]|nr:methyl viologen-reducing hydrogenase [bacterium]MBU1752650.1 methyl viologen-reducing hydrogenase [bacterium]
MAVKVAEEWLATCGGCEVTLLDLGEALLDLLPKLEFVHMPVIMDHKYYGQMGEREKLEIPEADVGLISGSVRNEENRHVAEEMRRKCKTLITVGACATYGGIPALNNLCTVADITKLVYQDTPSTDAAATPTQEIPALEERVYAVSEIVKVDIKLPGCPTTPELLAEALTCLLEGREFKLTERSVCDECPTKREKKAVTAIKRPLESVEFTPGQPLSEVRCFMEQGFLCQGPATMSGCGGSEKVTRCIKAYMPCRGCYGPIREGANPMVDMMGALSSIGLNPREIVDRAPTFNRFIGAQGRLKPGMGGR